MGESSPASNHLPQVAITVAYLVEHREQLRQIVVGVVCGDAVRACHLRAAAEGVVREASLQLVGVAGTLSKVTTLSLWVAPKPAPEIVNEDPTKPEEVEIPVIASASITLNVTPVLENPLTVTVTGPVVAFRGTFTEILVSLQRKTCAETPLNWTEP